MKKNEKVMLALLAVLLWMNFSSGLRIGRIEDRLDGINLNMRHIQENAMETRGQVKRSLEDFEKEHRWIANSSVDVTDYNWELNTVKVRADWVFNELEKDSNVYLMYGEKDDISGQVKSWHQIEAKNIGALNYEADMELSYESNYGMQIMAQKGDAQRSHVLRDLKIKENIENRIEVDGYMNSISSSGKGSIRVNVDNFFGDVEELKINSAFAYVYFKDKLIYKVDVLKEADRFSDDEIEDKGFEEYELRKEIHLDELIKDFKEYDFDEIRNNIEVEVVVKDGLGIEYKGFGKN